MDRDPARLRAAAARVEGDLQRTTGASWALTLGADLRLTITNGRQTAEVELDAEVDEALVDGVSPASMSAALDADADDAVAYEVSEELADLGVTWPVCPDHQQPLGVCSGLWFCEGKPYHDLADVGHLEAG